MNEEGIKQIRCPRCGKWRPDADVTDQHKVQKTPSLFGLPIRILCQKCSEETNMNLGNDTFGSYDP